MNIRRNWTEFPVPHNFIISQNFLLKLQNGQIHNTRSGFRGTRFSLSRQTVEIYDFLFIILEILIFWNQDLRVEVVSECLQMSLLSQFK